MPSVSFYFCSSLALLGQRHDVGSSHCIVPMYLNFRQLVLAYRRRGKHPHDGAKRKPA